MRQLLPVVSGGPFGDSTGDDGARHPYEQALMPGAVTPMT
jgi:hypothetical protein